MCFGGSLRILFGPDLSSVLYYRGLHSGRSTPMLRMWIGCVPIVKDNYIIILPSIYYYLEL
jgi:hypothetical protein